ncbi:MAG: phosphate regulon transcriptional regulatory protein PhoB [Alphaproteobacteria bacterium]|nr:phosphate regulon transcriptional regulatory protein PhoB [Alphaproteobacteria bacterium]
MKPLVLIVEDEAPQAELLRYNLERDGFRTALAGDGEEALLLAEEEAPDLVILDWMLPLLSGIEVCRRLRRKAESAKLPIIMLTARGVESDRIRGLDSGADDYLVKPFSPNELLARVRAILRRSDVSMGSEVIQYGGISMDLGTHKVLRDGKSIHLGPTEFRLLRVLLERPGHVFSREQLLDRAWGRDIHLESRTVDVHIRRLRQALNQEGGADIIRTVRGFGYAIDTEKD